ncbi:MAG: Cys-Xaa-Xaa-Xaa repeat radical SAM target protein [Muribaculaceae bacterium]|nr:Cys-Xaa-Xaa-Xaa repeat radical SAM target protein [Muribaculaceae bacterium]
MKDKRKEELQSRRQFFKKAAKSALPILGAIALSNIPLLGKASDLPSTGCNDGCTAACSRVCAGCQTSCHAANCYYTCHNGCDTTCKGTCYRTCSGGCDTSSSRY